MNPPGVCKRAPGVSHRKDTRWLTDLSSLLRTSVVRFSRRRNRRSEH
nr:MAG TPA: hypothetical protein [Caudoviricetes sp.]